jgi:hypothetical protein
LLERRVGRNTTAGQRCLAKTLNSSLIFNGSHSWVTTDFATTATTPCRYITVELWISQQDGVVSRTAVTASIIFIVTSTRHDCASHHQRAYHLYVPLPTIVRLSAATLYKSQYLNDYPNTKDDDRWIDFQRHFPQQCYTIPILWRTRMALHSSRIAMLLSCSVATPFFLILTEFRGLAHRSSPRGATMSRASVRPEAG